MHDGGLQLSAPFAKPVNFGNGIKRESKLSVEMSAVLRKRLSTCCVRKAMNCPTLTDPVATAPGTDCLAEGSIKNLESTKG